MALEILYSIVGKWGRAAIEWMLAHSTVTAAALLTWTILLLTGKAQLKQVEARTRALVLDGARRALAENSRLTANELYDCLYLEWRRMVRRSAWFVPHRWEMWPVPAFPAVVRDRLGFTPQWIVQHLSENGIRLRPSGVGFKPPQASPAKLQEKN